MSGSATRVCSSVYADQSFLRLTPQGKCVWLYLLTGPHDPTACGGMFKLTIKDAHSALRRIYGQQWMTTAAIDAALKAMESGGSIVLDEARGVWMLPNFLKYNKPASPKNMAGWAQALMHMPESPVVNAWLDHVERYARRRGPAFMDVYQESLSVYRVPLERVRELELAKPGTGGDEAPTLFEASGPQEKRRAAGWAIGLAMELRDSVAKVNNRHARTEDIARWADSIEKVHRLDGYSQQDIRYAMTFVVKDSFWQTVILSGANFRKHFPRLLAAAGRGAASSNDPFAGIREAT